MARAHPQVLADPEPAALFQTLGDSALLFELRVWTGRFGVASTTTSWYASLLASEAYVCLGGQCVAGAVLER